MTHTIKRLTQPMTATRCDDLPSALARSIWVASLIGLTTVNVMLATYAETLRLYGMQK